VETVEVHGMGMFAAVCEMDADVVPFGGEERWAGDATVVRPSGELNAGDDLDVLIDRHDFELAQRPSVGECRDPAMIEIVKCITRIETVPFMVNVPGSGQSIVPHRCRGLHGVNGPAMSGICNGGGACGGSQPGSAQFQEIPAGYFLVYVYL
jgi:hypothetical protein